MPGGCGGSDAARIAGDVIPEATAIDRTAFARVPHLHLDSLDVLCPGERTRCPSDELILAARGPDGDLAFASRTSNLFLLRAGTSGIEQIVFDDVRARYRAFGGTLEPRGDSAWALHMPGSPAVQAFNEEGRRLQRTAPPSSRDVLTTALARGFFVQLLLPPGSAVGDTVRAQFRAISSNGGDSVLVATLPLPARQRIDAPPVSMTPLPPFFTPEPLWRPTLRHEILYTSAESYELRLLTLDRARQVVVDVPPRPVTAGDLDLAGRRFMVGIPTHDRRFYEATAADVERRKRASAKVHPAITDLRLSEQGDILVRGSVDPDSGTVRWDVFSPDLEPRGYFVIDDIDRVLMVTHDSLLLARDWSAGRRVVQWMRMAR